MIVQIQHFASLRDAVESSQIRVEIPENASVALLLEVVPRNFSNPEKWLPHSLQKTCSGRK